MVLQTLAELFGRKKKTSVPQIGDPIKDIPEGVSILDPVPKGGLPPSGGGGGGGSGGGVSAGFDLPSSIVAVPSSAPIEEIISSSPVRKGKVLEQQVPTPQSFSKTQLATLGATTELLTKGATESDVSFESRQASIGRGIVQQQPLASQSFISFQEEIRQDISKIQSPQKDFSPLISAINPTPFSEREFTGNILQDTTTFLDLTFIQPFRGVKSGIKDIAGFTSGLESRGTIETTPLPLSTIIGGGAGLIPETPLGTAFIFGGLKALSLAPTIIRTGAGITFGVLGTKTALDPTLTGEERVTGGIIGGLGFLGASSEILPFGQGFLARFSPKFRSIKTEEVIIGDTKFEAEFIKDIPVPKTDEFLDIGLIKEGVDLKFSAKDFPSGGSALGRGGISRFSVAEQILGFKGKTLRLTTSQRGLEPIDKQFIPSTDVSEFGFFFTPADPITGIPQTRISRLGGGFLGLFDLPKSSEIAITFKRQQPQIIVTDPVRLGTKDFPINPKGTTELETTSLLNLKILGKDVTTIKGRKVDIFKTEFTSSDITKGLSKNIGDIVSKDFLSSAPTKRFVSPSGLLGSSVGLKEVLQIQFPRADFRPSRTKRPSRRSPSIIRGFSGFDSFLPSSSTLRNLGRSILSGGSSSILGDVFPPPPPPSTPPRIKLEGLLPKGGKKKKGKRKLTRTPSIEALNLGIFGKETLGEMSGLIGRPIVGRKSVLQILSQL